MKPLLPLLFVLLLAGCDERSFHKKEWQPKQTVEYVTPLIVDSISQMHPPSYIDPKRYRIKLRMGQYIAILPGGTELGTFDTQQEAQIAINEAAKESRERWIKHGEF